MFSNLANMELIFQRMMELIWIILTLGSLEVGFEIGILSALKNCTEMRRTCLKNYRH